MSTPPTVTPPMPLPVEDDHDTRGFFEAARRGELTVRTCSSCAATIQAPTAFCVPCGSWETHWRVVAGTGTVYTWTVAEHRTHPAFEVPYTMVLVQLDDAPARLMGYLPGRAELTVGQPMRVRFEHREDGTVLPNWEPA